MCESAIDTGGPLREFWRLLAEDVNSHLCQGDVNNRAPIQNPEMLLVMHRNTFLRVHQHDYGSFPNSDYVHLGKLMAMSLPHGGSGFPFFSPYVFEYFLSGNITDVTDTSEDIPNLLARDLTRKVLYFLFLLLRDLECDQ